MAVLATPESGHIDQLRQLVERMRYRPDSRRHLISAWNVAGHRENKLPPSTTLFSLRSRRQIVLSVTMRSVDIFLGLPFNMPVMPC